MYLESLLPAFVNCYVKRVVSGVFPLGTGQYMAPRQYVGRPEGVHVGDDLEVYGVASGLTYVADKRAELGLLNIRGVILVRPIDTVHCGEPYRSHLMFDENAVGIGIVSEQCIRVNDFRRARCQKGNCCKDGEYSRFHRPFGMGRENYLRAFIFRKSSCSSPGEYPTWE